MGGVRFDGDVVIVTGGAGGLGRCQATELGKRRARVVVNDRDGAHAVVDELNAGAWSGR